MLLSNLNMLHRPTSHNSRDSLALICFPFLVADVPRFAISTYSCTCSCIIMVILCRLDDPLRHALYPSNATEIIVSPKSKQRQSWGLNSSNPSCATSSFVSCKRVRSKLSTNPTSSLELSLICNRAFISFLNQQLSIRPAGNRAWVLMLGHGTE